MATEKTRRTGTPLQDILRGARRGTTETEELDTQPAARSHAPGAVPAPVVAAEEEDEPPVATAVVPGRAPATPALASPETLPPVAAPAPSSARAIEPTPAPPAAVVNGEVAALARRGQKARPTILIEPADLQTLRDWQAAAAAEWEARVLDDSKIVRALIQAAREAGVPVGTAGGEAHLRRLLVGVMRRGLASGGA